MERLIRSSALVNLMLVLMLAFSTFSASAKERITYFHNDVLGSPVAATDAQGALLWQEDYTPYGKRLLKQDTGHNSRWFTSKSEVAALGLQYSDARWYEADLGRFLSIDPADFNEGDIHSFNRYSYANNNPYRFVDLDGRTSAYPQSQSGFVPGADTLIYVGGGGGGNSLGPLQGLKRGLNPQGDFVTGGGPLRSVQGNRAQGKAGEAMTESSLRSSGSYSGKQVTIETSTGQRTVIDFVKQSRGGKGVVETKTGNAKLTKGQKQLRDDIKNNRPVIPRGKNAADAGLTPGRPTVFKDFSVDVPF